MRQILEIEEHVPVPPVMYSDPFYRITYLIKEEIRKHKWIEGEKGRQLSWKEARAEWTRAHRKRYEKFLLDTLSFPNSLPSAEETNRDSAQKLVRRSATLSMLPHRSGG
jgi:mannosyltransferase OCH1-like enzyme